MTLRHFVLTLPAALLLVGCASEKKAAPEQQTSAFSAKEQQIAIGGKPAVTLSQAEPADKTKPQIVSVDILPGRGMNIYQVRAWIPGRGMTDLFTAPSLEEAKQILNGGPEDKWGNKSFSIGGAILVPYANRIRGKLSADGQSLATTIAGKNVTLPANFRGKNAGAEVHSMHGLILDRAVDTLNTASGASEASVTGVINAGDFNGHWLSKTALTVTATLKPAGFGFTVTAKNDGTEPLPMGIGWHPYFNFPSGNRQQARVHIPGSERALVDNYDNVFPTGKLVPVKGTPQDVAQPGGVALNGTFFDDCFVNLQRNPDGSTMAVITDPAAKYGLRIKALSKEVKAYQMYAPVEKSFVALEPQFNWADPYSKIWKKGTDTGMVTLQPGESVSYAVELEVFVP